MPGLATCVLTLALSAATPQDPQAGTTDYASFDYLRYRDRVESDGTSTRTIEASVLLRTGPAVSQFGQIGSWYVDGYGDVTFEDIVIVKPDGRRTEAKTTPAEDLNPFGVTGTAMAADVRFKKLTIPGLEPGDKLSYRIVVRRKPLAPGRIFGEMKFVPIFGALVQRYELDLPRNAGVRVRLREGLGATWEEVPATADRLVRRVEVRVDLPAQDSVKTKEVAEVWAEPDVLFGSFASWDEVTRWWWGLARDRMSVDPSIREEAGRIVAGKQAPRERVEALHEFVASRIRYLNLSFGLGRMQPRSASDVLASRYGDCKDKEALLAALAAAVGVEVRPVLVNSARADLRDDVPGPQQFDHVVSVARLGPDPADWLWLDATNQFGVPGYLLPPLRDKRAVLVEASGEARVVRTPSSPPFVPKTEIGIRGALKADGTLHARVAWRERSDAEVQVRNVLAMTPQSMQADMVKRSLGRGWNDESIANVSVSNPAQLADPLHIEFDAEKKAVTGEPPKERTLDIPLLPVDLPELDKGGKDGPGGAKGIELAVGESVTSIEIELPEGLEARAPLSVRLERPFGSFVSSYSVDGKHIRMSRELKIVRRQLADDDRPSYEAFRKAVETDHDQNFTLVGGTQSESGPSAVSLHAQGLEAFDKKDYGNAVELLRKATDSDPKVRDGLLDLGRALAEEGRLDDAAQAFSRQIEISPFHEQAYAWRADILIRQNRWDDAEKDLLKEIEVAPFQAWSYQRLAERRTAQQRFAEATDLYLRGATIEPKEPKNWYDLAWSQKRQGSKDQARAALERAKALDPSDSLKLDMAGLYEQLDDPDAAGGLAATAVTSIAQRLAALSGENFGDGDREWVRKLAEAWRLVGIAALHAGDAAKAERYLSAAWTLTFEPGPAVALGNLRETQGRLAEAVELWSMAAWVPSARLLGMDLQARITKACQRLPPDETKGGAPAAGRPSALPGLVDRPPRQSAAEQRLMKLRTISLNGPVVADLLADVLLLTGNDGRVEKVRSAYAQDASAVQRQIAACGPIHLTQPHPEDSPYKAVRKGLLACSRASSCGVVLEMPGMSAFDQTARGTTGSVEIVSADPQDGSTLHRGESVKLALRLSYKLSGAQHGEVMLGVLDQGGAPLLQVVPKVEAAGPSGVTSIETTFLVPPAATAIHVFVSLITERTELPSGGALLRYVVR